MTRRLAARIAGTVLATAGAVAALTIPATATETHSAQSDTMLQAMQRDLHLTKEQAQERMARDVAAARTQHTLRDKLGNSFGGAYIDEASGKLVVGVTDAAQSAVVNAAGAQARQVAFSDAQLNGVVDALNKAHAPASVTSWHVDPKLNSVVVTAKPGAVAEATSFAQAGGLPQAVKVVESAAQPRTYADVLGGDPYTINSSARCSVGFAVDGGFVSAGHCGKQGDTTDPAGTFAGSQFPGNDFSYVKLTSDTAVGQVRTDNGTQPVAGSTEAPVGSSVCRSGSTTGWHCGQIQATNQSVQYSEGAVDGLTQTNVCAEPGDSGGSFISGDQAQGMTSGGSGDCTNGGTTYFQPVNEALQAFGVKLVTQ